jgi:hypothetical protein
VWSQQLDELFDCATVDMDGSNVETTGECKFGMDMSYKGIWGYRIQVVDIEGTKARRLLRLYNVTARQAGSIFRHIEDIVSARLQGTRAS